MRMIHLTRPIVENNSMVTTQVDFYDIHITESSKNQSKNNPQVTKRAIDIKRKINQCCKNRCKMDPIFGLPCITESKSMDAARTRNQSQEKKLADKFGALAMDMKSRSSKIITKKSDVEEFMTRIDFPTSRLRILPMGLSQGQKLQYKQLVRKAGSLSMTLSELDRRLADRKTKSNKHSRKIVASEKNTEPTSSSDGYNKEGDEPKHQGHLVNLGDQKSVLPINRKKHAMRDAWNRAISEDVKFKYEAQKGSLNSPMRQPYRIRNYNITSGSFHTMGEKS